MRFPHAAGLGSGNFERQSEVGTRLVAHGEAIIGELVTLEVILPVWQDTTVKTQFGDRLRGQVREVAPVSDLIQVARYVEVETIRAMCAEAGIDLEAQKNELIAGLDSTDAVHALRIRAENEGSRYPCHQLPNAAHGFELQSTTQNSEHRKECGQTFCKIKSIEQERKTKKRMHLPACPLTSLVRRM